MNTIPALDHANVRRCVATEYKDVDARFGNVDCLYHLATGEFLIPEVKGRLTLLDVVSAFPFSHIRLVGNLNPLIGIVVENLMFNRFPI